MKILLPYDRTDCAQKALEWAAHNFHRWNTEFHLLFVIQVFPESSNTIELDIEVASEILQSGKSLLERLGCKVVHTEHTFGSPSGMICRFAREEEMDLVVMGSHGRCGLSKLFMGSVAGEVLEHCPSPVVVIRKDMKIAEENILPSNCQECLQECSVDP